jgi:hypothetical protein
MRLSDRVNQKVIEGISNLADYGMLHTERNALDHELVPSEVPSPDGKGTITVFVIKLFAPTGLGLTDRVTRGAILHDPYMDQGAINEMIRKIYVKIQEEIAEAQKEIPAGTRSGSGLYIPGGKHSG